MEKTLAIAPSELDPATLAEWIREEFKHFAHARDVCISAGRVALERAVKLGELFTAALDRFPGNYEEWVECNFGDSISVRTSQRYRQLWQHRIKILADEPALATLKDAYVHLGILPPPEPDQDKTAPTERPPYTLRLVIDTSKPLKEWPRSDLNDFILQTNRVAELRAEALNLIAEL